MQKQIKISNFYNGFIRIRWFSLGKQQVFQHFRKSCERAKNVHGDLLAFRCGRPSKTTAAWKINGEAKL